VESGATIKLYRAKGNFRPSSVGSYRVKVDKVEVGEISPNQVQVYRVTPGSHSVYVEYLWRRWSPEVDISLIEGEEVVLTCRSGWASFPKLERATPEDVANIANMPRTEIEWPSA
jgi:hypothetical protein